MSERDRQPELFDVPAHPRLRRGHALPFASFTVHADHLVLLVIGGLISVSVVFALGVERGKRLLFSAASPSDLQAAFTGSPGSQPKLDAKTKATVSSPAVPAAPPQTAPSPTKTPAPKKMLKAPVRVAAESPEAECAIQVVSYRNPALAQQELQRLHRQGEQAFLVQKTDRVLLFVGPFPSKARASEKLAGLKRRYQDCFIKTL